MKRGAGLVVILVMACYLTWASFVQVDETEFVVVTQFGNPVRVVMEAGLIAKWPDPVQTVTRMDKRLQALDSNESEYLTRDKKNLVVSSFILWRIADPIKFLQSVGDVRKAALRLSDMIASELGVAIGTYPLSEFLDTEDEETAIPELEKKVTSVCSKDARSAFGVELLDVRLRRMNFPRQNLRSVYDRMKSERERIAKKYLAEGEEQAARIRAETDQEVRGLKAEAYREAQEKKGKGEAETIRIYAEAFGKDPAFYKLTRTLEAYKLFLDDKTTLILNADSPLFRHLQHPPEASDR